MIEQIKVILEKIEKADNELGRVATNPAKNFRMCVPVQDSDTDEMIGGALRASKDMLEEILKLLEAK